jgi:hypothetical protein
VAALFVRKRTKKMNDRFLYSSDPRVNSRRNVALSQREVPGRSGVLTISDRSPCAGRPGGPLENSRIHEAWQQRVFNQMASDKARSCRGARSAIGQKAL